MKTVLDPDVRGELIARIGGLSASDRALWGKMDVGQMVKHCVLSQEWFLQGRRMKGIFLGRLIGRTIFKKVMSSELMRKNSPSLIELVFKYAYIDLDREKGLLIVLVKEYEMYAYPADGFVHPFFGLMTREQIGEFVYKHLHHHLRQFGR